MPRQIERAQERLPRASVRYWLGGWQEWLSISLLFLALEIAVHSIEQAHWVSPQPSLTLILTLAVLAGWLLVKSRLPGALTYPLALLLGAAVTLWQASSSITPSPTASPLNQLMVALQSWWQATTTAKPPEGTVHFVVFLIFFTWAIGYISTWFILQKRNAWVGASLGAITILVNLSNLPTEHYRLFFFYLLAAMLLIAQTNLARHHQQLDKRGISQLKRGMVYFIPLVLCLSLLMVSAAWLIPEARVVRVDALITAKAPLKESVEGYLTNFFATVPAKLPLLKSGGQKALSWGEPFGRSEKVEFVITSNQTSYWRARTYDIYNSSGWVSSNTTERLRNQGVPSAQPEKLSSRSEITYTVETGLKTDIMLTAGDFVSSDIPALVQTLPSRSFDIDLLQPMSDSTLPPDVASLAGSLRAAQAAKDKLSLNELRQSLPTELVLTGIGATHRSPTEANYKQQLALDNGRLSSVRVTRTQAGDDIVAVTSPHLLEVGQRYSVTSSVSSATPADLSLAGDSYPLWVTDYYLQLPPTLPERVRELSETITREAKSPYDKALAVKNYLSRIPYAVETKLPPQGVDGVDYFLFTQKSGNCLHFASATVVMLRSIGIPARLCVGYLPGKWDAATGSYLIQAKDYHAWSEVYFAGHGWVGFETTPAAGIEPRPIPGMGGTDMAYLYGEDWEEWWWSDEETGGGSTGTGGEATPMPGQLGSTLRSAGIGIISLVIVSMLLMLILRSIISRWLRLRGPDYASETYRKMCFLTSRMRLSPRPQQTPLEYRDRLTSAFPLQAEALGDIFQAYIERQFSGRKELGPMQSGTLQKSWHLVYPVLLRHLFQIKGRSLKASRA